MRSWKTALKTFVTAWIICWLLTIPGYARAVTVVIDPGHGGSDPGAIGVNGLYEKHVNRDVSEKLKAELERMGYRVLLTSDTDRTMSLQERVEFKERHNADVFVSVHANSHPSPEAHGSMVLYYDSRYPQERYPASPEMAALTPKSKQLASYVAEALSERAGTYNRGIVPSAVYVVRNGTMPSILVETAFLSNPVEAAKLADESFRRNVALGIAEGIFRFLPPVFSDISGHWAKDAILRMNEKGIVEGNNGRFDPDRKLSRAEFLAMADRLFRFSGLVESKHPEHEKKATVSEDVYAADPGGPAAEKDPSQPDESSGRYSDLSPDHWGYSVMMNAVEAGIVNGYPDGTLRPDEPVTRAEMAVLFDRIWSSTSRQRGEQLPLAAALQPAAFADVPDNEWYTGSVYRLVRANLIYGTGNNRFEPARPMTRAEAAVMFDRFYSRYVQD